MSIDEGTDRDYLLLHTDTMSFQAEIHPEYDEDDFEEPLFDLSITSLNDGALLMADIGDPGDGDVVDARYVLTPASLSRSDLMALGLSLIEVAIHETPADDTAGISALMDAVDRSDLSSDHLHKLAALLGLLPAPPRKRSDVELIKEFCGL